MDDPDDAEEERWCASERAGVIAYLRGQGLAHGEVGEWPAWHVWPYVALWAVESVQYPGSVGWWAISGDLPNDYVGCGPERHPREGLRDIATRWKVAAGRWAVGEDMADFWLGAPEDQATLAPLLATRAEMLLEFGEDDQLWDEDA